MVKMLIKRRTTDNDYPRRTKIVITRRSTKNDLNIVKVMITRLKTDIQDRQRTMITQDGQIY